MRRSLSLAGQCLGVPSRTRKALQSGLGSRCRGAIFQDFEQDMLAFLGANSMQQGSKRSNITPLAPDDFSNVLRGYTHLQNAGGFSISC